MTTRLSWTGLLTVLLAFSSGDRRSPSCAVTLDLGPNGDPKARPIGSLAERQLEQVRALREP